MHRFSLILLLLSLFGLSACAGVAGRVASPSAYGYYTASPQQCVPYARDVSGVNIYGNAHTWWSQAAIKGYERGNVPQKGAVFVLAKTAKLSYGHLSVVKKVKNSRLITVTHSNWGDGPISRRMVYKSMKLKDVSVQNNWTQVKFWNPEIDAYGLPYAAYGFIYP